MKKEECRQGMQKANLAMTQPEDPFMKVDEVAFMLRVSVRSVWRLIASGEFPNRVKIRRCLRLPLSDVQVYLSKHKCEAIL